MTLTEHFSLSHFDRVKVEHAVDQSANHGAPVAVRVDHHGVEFRIVVQRAALNEEQARDFRVRLAGTRLA